MTRLVEVTPIKEIPSLRYRAADEAECAVMGKTVKEMVQVCSAQSLECFTVTVKGEIIAVWGYMPQSMLDTTARIWMFSTHNADLHCTTFAKTASKLAVALLKKYPRLELLIDADYSRAIALAVWCRFKRDREIMINGRLFYIMKRERE